MCQNLPFPSLLKLWGAWHFWIGLLTKFVLAFVVEVNFFIMFRWKILWSGFPLTIVLRNLAYHINQAVFTTPVLSQLSPDLVSDITLSPNTVDLELDISLPWAAKKGDQRPRLCWEMHLTPKTLALACKVAAHWGFGYHPLQAQDKTSPAIPGKQDKR